MKLRKQRGVGYLFVAIMLLLPAPVAAQSSSSSNYRVDQTFFGSGGELDAASGSYRAKQTAGELGIGNTASANFQAFAGFNTTEAPYLEFVVTADNIDLGYLDPGTATTANGVFYVRAWQASGYAVRTEADPPTNPAGGGSQIAPLATPTASSPGTEQFGMNLVANTSPTNYGADPQQSPDASFAFGEVAADYDTPNVFKYAKSDIIASSPESSSVTIYTISYLFNISNATPAGEYTFSHTLVATGTY